MNDLDHYAFIFGCAYAEACGKDPGDDVALLGQADRAGLAAVIEEVRKERPTEADQRDAARYRWLLDNLESLAEWMDNDIPADRLDRTIDANMAIDAAMRQSAGEGK